ncbi:MAG: alpha/beta hydrolase family protein [Anaerolineae bacterium]
MDFFTQWLLGYQTYGGAEWGECLAACDGIRDGDPASWVEAWSALGSRLQAQADRSREHGHGVSARTAYLRAAMAYRTASLCAHPREPRFLELLDRLRATFAAAGALFTPAIEAIRIPCGERQLVGYVARASSTVAPLLIAVGGVETCVEEMYFWAAAPAMRRGHHTLFVELPGQGAAAMAGLSLRDDAQPALRAMLDYAWALPQIDTARVALYGVGSGSLLGTYALLAEPRFRAAAMNPPVTDLHRLLVAEVPAPLIRAAGLLGGALGRAAERLSPVIGIAVERLLWQTGAENIGQLVDLTKATALGKRVSDIRCPVLCMLSDGEPEEQKRQAVEFCKDLQARGELRRFSAVEGAAGRSQINNLSLSHEVLFDWLAETWGVSSDSD